MATTSNGTTTSAAEHVITAKNIIQDDKKASVHLKIAMPHYLAQN
jgi:hypothetical protein